jgi:hypothetical protein
MGVLAVPLGAETQCGARLKRCDRNYLARMVAKGSVGSHIQVSYNQSNIF